VATEIVATGSEPLQRSELFIKNAIFSALKNIKTF
jgi:hypothetical protein